MQEAAPVEIAKQAFFGGELEMHMSVTYLRQLIQKRQEPQTKTGGHRSARGEDEYHVVPSPEVLMKRVAGDNYFELLCGEPPTR